MLETQIEPSKPYNLFLSNQALEAFYQRLISIKANPIGKELSEYITQEIRDNVLEYIHPSSKQNAADSNTAKDNLHSILNNLKPGSSYRLPKEASSLQRTIQIVRSVDGEYKLFLDTKSKLSNHTTSKPNKNKPVDFNGGKKKGKFSWRIDGGEQKYILFVGKNDKIHREDLEKEARISQLLSKISDKFLPAFLGSEFSKNNTNKRTIYAKFAEGDRFTLNFKTIAKLPLIKKYELILGLFKAYKVIHDEGYVHGDISYGNIIYVNHQYLALIDFDTVNKIGSNFENPTQTYDYSPPEVQEWTEKHKLSNEYYYNYYHNYEHNGKKHNSLGRDFWLNFWKNCKDRSSNQNIDHVHPAGDIWSLGIIAFQILHRTFKPNISHLEFIKKHRLLNGMLQPFPSDRININQAIKLCQDVIDAIKKLATPSIDSALVVGKQLTPQFVHKIQVDATIKNTAPAENNAASPRSTIL